VGGLTRELTNFIKFAQALDARNSCNGKHSYRVAKLMVDFAKQLAFSREEIKLAYLAGTMHDIGKIAVPESILYKPAPLTKREFAIVKRHPDIGAEMLSGISGFEKITATVRYHHERFDGKGYPYGLQGQSIPLLSRMLALCDAYDAITVIRCYRKPFAPYRAIEEIELLSGTQFDPEISGEFIKSVNKNSSEQQGADFSTAMLPPSKRRAGEQHPAV
jgi:HD-GYP domain-containing protein (c-di-GMP phosphodiesterase class II)